MVNIVAAAVAGIAVDKFGRVVVLRSVFFIMLLVSANTAIAVLYLPSHASTLAVFVALCVSSALSGFGRGVFLVAFEVRVDGFRG